MQHRMRGSAGLWQKVPVCHKVWAFVYPAVMALLQAVHDAAANQHCITVAAAMQDQVKSPHKHAYDWPPCMHACMPSVAVQRSVTLHGVYNKATYNGARVGEFWQLQHKTLLLGV